MQTIKNVSISAVNDFVEKNCGECIDFASGTLIDNAVYSFPFGTLFCFEEYMNEWASGYVLLFFNKNHERGIEKAWKRFGSLKVDG